MFTGRYQRELRSAEGLMACVALAIAALAAPARADLENNLSDVVFMVQASNANGTGSFAVTQDMGMFIGGNMFLWSLGAPMNILDGGGGIIGTIDAANTAYMGDPQIAAGFAVTAGALDTTFTITSGLLSFPTIANPGGLVSAGLTLTDGNGNGAFLSGPGDVLASYQFNGFVPGGTTFVELVAPGGLAAGPGQSSAAAADTGGFIPLGQSAFDMSFQFSFTLSAGDLASATSNYVIQSLPAPAGLAVLAAGGLIGRRRRRA